MTDDNYTPEKSTSAKDKSSQEPAACMNKRVVTKEDGRRLIYYSFARGAHRQEEKPADV